MSSYTVEFFCTVGSTPTYAGAAGECPRLYPRGMCAYLRSASGQVLEGFGRDAVDQSDTTTTGLHLYFSDETNSFATESAFTSDGHGGFPFIPCPISCSLSLSGAGLLTCVYADGGNVMLAASANQARTFLPPQTVLTPLAPSAADDDPWMLATHAVDPHTGMLVVMAYRDRDASWYLATCALGDDGMTWTAGTPRLLVAADKAGGGSLIAAGNRWVPPIWRFAYTAGGEVDLITCRALAGDGTGTWSAPQVIADASGGYSEPGLYLDERDGMLLVSLYQAVNPAAVPPVTIPGMFALVGRLGDDAVTWNFPAPVRMTDAAYPPGNPSATHQSDGSQAAPYRRRDGAWEVFYRGGWGGTPPFVAWLAKHLMADGSGGPW